MSAWINLIDTTGVLLPPHDLFQDRQSDLPPKKNRLTVIYHLPYHHVQAEDVRVERALSVAINLGGHPEVRSRLARRKSSRARVLKRSQFWISRQYSGLIKFWGFGWSIAPLSFSILPWSSISFYGGRLGDHSVYAISNKSASLSHPAPFSICSTAEPPTFCSDCLRHAL